MTKILPLTVRVPSETDCFCGAKNKSEHIWVKEPGDRTICQSLHTSNGSSYRTCSDKPPEDLCDVDYMEEVSS